LAPAKSRKTTRRRARAFTLVEVLIVITVIAMVAAIALPSIVALFGSGAQEQAYNHLAALLTASRAVAIRNATYAGVHVQMSKVDGMKDFCYAAVVWDDPGTEDHRLSLMKGYEPRKIPGRIAFGEISTDFVSGSEYKRITDIEDFTTFSIVFSPSGAVVQQIDGEKLQYKSDDEAFGGTTKLWDRPEEEDGVMAVVLFDYVELDVRKNNASRVKDYLDESGQYLSVNIYTGQLFKRK